LHQVGYRLHDKKTFLNRTLVELGHTIENIVVNIGIFKIIYIFFKFKLIPKSWHIIIICPKGYPFIVENNKIIQKDLYRYIDIFEDLLITH